MSNTEEEGYLSEAPLEAKALPALDIVLHIVEKNQQLSWGKHKVARASAFS